MESDQERFTHTMDLLELEVAGLEQHEDVTMVNRVSKLVGEMAGRLTDAESKCKSFLFTVCLWFSRREQVQHFLSSVHVVCLPVC